VVVVADGHIYNAEELEPASEATVAAIVLAEYRRHGLEEALGRINGDFALALYDSRQDALWLVADRVGTRPLYWTRTSDGVFFASQPRGLLAVPGVSRKVSRQFTALFAGSHYRVIDNDLEGSPYADIQRVPSAHALKFNHSGVVRTRYWSLQDLEDHEGAEDALAEQYRFLLFDSVSRRLKAASDPAFTLSGGMDSSSVLASAVKMTGAKQHAFSVGYEDRTYDESDEARTMVASAVSEWHHLVVGTPDVFAVAEKMIAIHDEPVATATWLSHYLLCADAGKHGFRALFGGLGGDELNAGEYEHFWYFFACLKAAGDATGLAREVDWWIHYHDHPIFQKNAAVVERDLPRLADLSQQGRCLADRRRIERYADTVNREYFDIRAFEPVMDHPFRSYLKNRTYQDMVRETIPCCLRAEDRHTVAFGIDNFMPFFDHRLIEFMFRIPGHRKFHNGVTKHLLRRAMIDVLPEETRTRAKKAGWNAPAHVWFTSAAREPLRDLVHSHSFRERGVYNVAEVERLIAEHEQIVSTGAAVDNHMMFLWQLVNVELWLRQLDA
jgi:asparagine synthase (glutamine-hydrolysing)